MADAQYSTPFIARATVGASAAIGWLLRSIEACGGQGSARFYSRWYVPLRGWSWPYPETTGYLIPTLLNYARFADRPELVPIALRQADWILTLQMPDGSLPGGHIAHGKASRGPSVFNTGQMILGLVAAFDESGDAKYLDAAARAAAWLASGVDAATGTWTSHAYVAGHSPAYHTRVCWPMLAVHTRRPDPVVESAAQRALRAILSWQQPHGGFAHWAFVPGRPAFTHTIAYTIRGFLESAALLGDGGRSYFEAALRCADVFRRKLELGGGLAGAYDQDLRGVTWYTCLTGNCQMAIIWMKLHQATGDARLLSAALKALSVVMARQKLRTLDRQNHGAIAGSSPLWGRYLTMRYPNWAPKFFVDALMEACTILQAQLGEAPCASS
jgi:hypothetical protein